MSPTGLLAVSLPALDHVLARDTSAAVALLDRLQERLDELALTTRLEGERVMARVEAPLLLKAAAALVSSPVQAAGVELGVAAAVGYGPVFCRDNQMFGPIATQTRRLVLLARPQEVLCPEPLQAQLPLPDGVGLFRAPAAVRRLVGAEVHVLRVYQ